MVHHKYSFDFVSELFLVFGSVIGWCSMFLHRMKRLGIVCYLNSVVCVPKSRKELGSMICIIMGIELFVLH